MQLAPRQRRLERPRVQRADRGDPRRHFPEGRRLGVHRCSRCLPCSPLPALSSNYPSPETPDPLRVFVPPTPLVGYSYLFLPSAHPFSFSRHPPACRSLPLSSGRPGICGSCLCPSRRRVRKAAQLRRSRHRTRSLKKKSIVKSMFVCLNDQKFELLLS